MNENSQSENNVSLENEKIKNSSDKKREEEQDESIKTSEENKETKKSYEDVIPYLQQTEPEISETESVDSMENFNCDRLSEMVDSIITDFDSQIENKSYEIEYDEENDFKTKNGSVYTYPIEDMLTKQFGVMYDTSNKTYSVKLCIYKVNIDSNIPYLTFLLKNRMEKYEFIDYSYTNTLDENSDTEEHDDFLEKLNQHVGVFLRNKQIGGNPQNAQNKN